MPFRMSSFGERYSPLYFLAALGAGGLAVTFFLQLMFWLPHPGQPVPIFEDVMAALQTGGLFEKVVIAISYAGVAFFTLLHVRLLAWNLSEYAAFRRTETHMVLRTGNAETQLLAIPLTLAMSINVGFVVGLLFVPGLWSIVEYLFPFAMVGFIVVGVYALRLMGDFLGRVMTIGGFDCTKNNSFAQMLPAFALSMVAVGLAAPAAMSTTPLVAGLSFIASTFFVVAAAMLGAVALFLGMRAMMENGANAEATPTLWVAIPIVTVLSIALLRQEHGLHVHFGVEGEQAQNFMMLTTALAAQLLFGMLGVAILRRQRYFERYLRGPEKSPGSFALVCPGVALSVMTQFYIHKGLVAAGIVAKFSVAYWLLIAIAVAFQIATIVLLFRLTAKHFNRAERNFHHPLASAG